MIPEHALLVERARARDAAGVRALLAPGVPPDPTDEDGATALDYALGDAGAAEVLAALLEAGADPNRPGDCSPLYLAAAHPELVALLLGHGAEPNRATPRGETPLSFCASWGHLASAELLLAAGADPNHVDEELGWSVLFFAAADGHVAIARALLDAGADPLWTNARGQRALWAALDHDRPEVADLLADREPWSEVTRGLRGRVRARRKGGLLELEVELGNASDSPLSVLLDHPGALEWSMERGGAPMQPLYGRTEILSSPRWQTLAPGRSARWRVSHRKDPEEGGGDPDLDVVSAAWKIPPDGAVLHGVYQVTPESLRHDRRAPKDAWTGALRLPPLALPPPRRT